MGHSRRDHGVADTQAQRGKLLSEPAGATETCAEGNAVQMITHVEVTPSCGGDAGVTVGVIDRLRERGIGPSELWCDTSYGSGHNGWEAERRGTELVSPVGGRAPAEADRGDGPVRLTAADFDIAVTARRAAVCPAGHEAVSEYGDEEAPERVEMHFAREVCESCKLRSRCPVRWRRRPELGGEWSPSGAYVLSAASQRASSAGGDPAGVCGGCIDEASG